MNRAANDGVKLLANVDTFPLLGCGAQDLRAIVAEAAGVAPEQILGHDLFLYLRGRGSVLGAEGELIGSPKLDDLACAFALTEGFLQSSPSGAIPVLAVSYTHLGVDRGEEICGIGEGKLLLRAVFGNGIVDGAFGQARNGIRTAVDEIS